MMSVSISLPVDVSRDLTGKAAGLQHWPRPLTEGVFDLTHVVVAPEQEGQSQHFIMTLQQSNLDGHLTSKPISHNVLEYILHFLT